MDRNTFNRVSELSFKLNELQSNLGCATVAVGSRRNELLNMAQRLAADISEHLEAWQMDLLHVPPAERATYLAPNPYLSTVERRS